MTAAFGNASSSGHEYGDEADAAVIAGRKAVAALVGARAQDVVFTSGATEAINLVLQGRALSLKRPVRIGLTPIEHPAVRETALALEARGQAECVWLEVDSEGRVDLSRFEAHCRRGLDLACVILGHNEIGTVQDGARLASIARQCGVEALFDATQAAGRIAVMFEDWGASYMVLSAHKMYGPKGVGALVRRSDTDLSPLLFGGGQQRGARPGTLPVALIAGFGEAARLRKDEMRIDEQRIETLRDVMEQTICGGLSGVRVSGAREARLAGNLHLSIDGVVNTVLQARLRDRLAFSVGSACASASGAPSFALRGLGWSDQRIRGAIRFGLGKFTTHDEVSAAASLVMHEVAEIRALETDVGAAISATAER